MARVTISGGVVLADGATIDEGVLRCRPVGVMPVDVDGKVAVAVQRDLPISGGEISGQLVGGAFYEFTVYESGVRRSALGPFRAPVAADAGELSFQDLYTTAHLATPVGTTISELIAAAIAEHVATVEHGGGGTGGDPVAWEQITGTPDTYPPITHGHPILEIEGLTEALAGKSDSDHAHAGVYEPAGAAMAAITATRGVADGIAPLGADTKIPITFLPSLAITETFVVGSDAEMLALSAERGDVAIRTDLHRCFILASDAPEVVGNWKELLAPTDAVLSVNGQTGAVTVSAAGLGALVASGNLADLSDVAAARANLGLGSAALLSAPVSGDASAGEVVTGSDSRLSDARTPTAHGHSSSEIGDFVEAVHDAVAALLTEGSGIELTYDDETDKLTLSVTGGGGGTGAPAGARYLLSEAHESLPDAIVVPSLIVHPDAVRGSIAEHSWEFDGSTLPDGYDWINQGASTATVELHRLILVAAPESNYSMLTWPVGHTDTVWRYRAKITLMCRGSDAHEGALIVRDSVGGKSLGVHLFPGASPSLYYTRMTAGGGIDSAVAVSASANMLRVPTFWAEIELTDGGNLVLRYSVDGVYFQQMANVPRATHLANDPDRIGVYGLANTTVICDYIRREA